MYLKAFLFGCILILCVSVLFMQAPTWTTAALLVLVIWSACRLYYFAFYVIEKYIDPTYRYSGLVDAVRWAVRGKR